MKKAEPLLVAISLCALAMNLFLIPSGEMLTVLSLGVLSMFYFYTGFAYFNEIKLNRVHKIDSYREVGRERLIGGIGTGIALSIVVIGILFKFQSWPLADIFLSIGLIALALVTTIALVKYLKKPSSYYTRIFRRVAIFGGLGIALAFVSSSDFLRFKYRNYPSYAEARVKAGEDPGNKELWENVKAEREKIEKERIAK